MRNINNIFEARAVEVLDPVNKEIILLAKTTTKAKEYLRLENAKLISDFINSGKILFSKTLNKGVIINDYKEKWQNKKTMIFPKEIVKKK